ncbi:Krueppel-like factor 17 [Sturnira hondurensis]|uniref:Krueppel-like factor 17 n=1 Tax=Sturnira hondurensis TaxID=192404 RepID=UPI0018799B08|nr:Krueppel-like factor 17 [Sturnira hondurensis]
MNFISPPLPLSPSSPKETEESVSTLDVSPSPRSSGGHTSWNRGPSGLQHILQCPQLERVPLASAEASKQHANEAGPPFSVWLPQQDANYGPRVTLSPSRMTSCQGLSPSQPGMTIFKGPQVMSFGESSIPGMAMTFSGNLGVPSSGPPDTGSSGIPLMSRDGVPTVPYSCPPMTPSNRDSSTPEMLLAPTMPPAEDQAVLPSLAQMLPPREPHDCQMPPAGSPALLAFESQDSFVSQPASQEDPFLPEQPLPAPQRAEQNCGAQDRAPRRRPAVARPYSCQYEDCGKAYTKRSHLVSHQRKHTGERPYKCMWEGCAWSFFRSDELGRHMRIHTRYRPHRCDQCGRQFMRSDHLRQHQRIHLRVPGSPHPQANDGQMAGPPASGL